LSFLGRVGNWAWPNRLKILKSTRPSCQC
jgi:hypothetical protein